MAAIGLLLGIVCLAGVGRSVLPGGNLLSIARREVGVKERTGQNDGPRVEAYLGAVGLKKGNPWCAAFVCWTFKQAGYALPRTAWSPDLFPKEKRVSQPVPGSIFSIYFPVLKRIGHCGFVEYVYGHWIGTIEGNTSGQGSREGDGVYRKFRHIRTLKSFADWREKNKGFQRPVLKKAALLFFP